MTGFYPPAELANRSVRVRAWEQIKAHYTIGQPTHVVSDYNVPGWYQDPKGFVAAVEGPTADAAAAYLGAVTFAMTGNAAAKADVQRILSAWALGNHTVTGHDGQLSMAEIGAGLLLADILTGGSILASWTMGVYLPAACDPIKADLNNWGAWGLWGALLGRHHIGQDTTKDVALLGAHIAESIAADGTMPLELARGAGGIWYTYYALASTTAAARLVRNAGGPDYFRSTPKLPAALNHLLAWVESNPANQTLPKASDPWPNDLFEAMGAEYSQPAYTAYAAEKRPILYVSHHFAWPAPTLLHAVLEP